MSEEKILYKLYIDDYNSETFEDYLTQRCIRLQKENEALRKRIEEIEANNASN